jgi:hypothetical protein
MGPRAGFFGQDLEEERKRVSRNTLYSKGVIWHQHTRFYKLPAEMHEAYLLAGEVPLVILWSMGWSTGPESEVSHSSVWSQSNELTNVPHNGSSGYTCRLCKTRRSYQFCRQGKERLGRKQASEARNTESATMEEGRSP